MTSELYLAIPGMSTLTDLSTSQFMAVIIDTAHALTVVINSANTDRPIGILQDNPKGATGVPVPATVAYTGICKAVVGANGWTRGDRLGVDGSGGLITLTEAIATTNNCWICAVALDTASAGTIARVLLLTPYLGNHT